MKQLVCKMCGGTLNINNSETIAECEYCGSKQTVPKIDDNRKANLYDRANHFRRNNEFDKAAGIYEQILNEGSADAEAYWSLVLCRYGIEYVEDLVSHKRVPTVNRAQYTSIFDDDNYKSALQYADSYQKIIYEEEAKAINEIQKGILEISQKEEPFDVFICYKETDNNGRRTPDSVLANDLYYQLTQEGYKVFFSRITLEDKLGSAYEPYIFAALNSAKVMVVLGTKPEYFNAVWVKNEWSRYLGLIKNGAQKVLVPAYRDMDPYDLPEEFSHLQAQDMSKLGFMQDLIRGIKKITQVDMPSTTVVKETVITGGNSSVEPLLKRAFMFLEDGDFDKADEFCEQVLNLNPECAEAYLGKLMAEMGACKQEELKDCEEPFDDNNNYQKVVRFADDEVKRTLAGYIDYINIRNENNKLNEIYTRARDAMTSSGTEEAFKEIAQIFESIKDYKDSAELITECYAKAEIARKDAIYINAKTAMAQNSIAGYDKAMRLYKVILDFKDSGQQMAYCQKKLEEMKAKDEAERIERERFEEITRKEAERIAKRNKKIVIIVASLICSVIAFILVLNTVIIPNSKYNGAMDLMGAEKYKEAIEAFETLEGYKDSETQIKNCYYKKAIALKDAGEYKEAIEVFEALEGYKDSKTQIKNCYYKKATALKDTGEYKEAIDAFKELGGYKDSAEKVNSIYEEYKNFKLKEANVGDSIYFGTYEQDNDVSNGNEYVEWLVLSKESNRMLVISKYALDYQKYHMDYVEITWDTCSLRKWMNDTFINNLFSSDEQAMIPTVTVSVDKDPECTKNSGNTTQDRVFLLSKTEVNQYFSSDEAKECVPTNYAIGLGAQKYKYMKDEGTCEWWLRTAQNYDYDNVSINASAAVSVIGSFEAGGGSVNIERAVRPALWINLEP